MKHTLKKSPLMPFNRLTAIALSALLIAAPLTEASAAVIYEKREADTVASGITYENITQITDAGMIDVNVVYVDLKNHDIDVKPVQSKTNYGAKEDVYQMVSESGAMAGINADFFDMALSPATPFGNVVIDSHIVSLDENMPGYATFFTDLAGTPFIEYLEPDIVFLNNGESNIKVHAMNKYKRDFSAVYFDRNAILNTAELDKKFPDLVKFVVTDNVISYISQGGETVEVPENGYIILCAATYAQYFYESVKVGQTAEILINARFDYNKMETAIGGAGKILENGAYSNYGYVVNPDARNPRSAIGITQDNSKLILAVVDGRGASVGATHAEMAEIMLNLGAYNAMHFDGGGSSTLVADTNQSKGLEVKNTPSEASLRKIVNSLGVFNTAPVGPAEAISLQVSEDRVFFGEPVSVTLTGLDYNSKKTQLPDGSVLCYTDDPEGRWEGSMYYPGREGLINIYGEYNGFTDTKTIENMPLAQIVPSVDSLKMVPGESVALTFEGISTSGHTTSLNDVTFEVNPNTLGTVSEDGVFTAAAGEVGYIKCSKGNIAAYIDVALGTRAQWVTGFDDKALEVAFSGSDDTIKGSASYDDAVNNPGNFALSLNYQFNQSTETQAAYLTFAKPILFEEDLSAIQLAAYGHGMGGWLRARIIDSTGQDYTVDISKDVNFTGWQKFNINIPKEAKQPISLDRLYIASLNNTDTSAKCIYFDDLQGLYAIDYGRANVPAGNQFVNPYEAVITGESVQQSVDLTFVGDLIIDDVSHRPENYAELQKNALSTFYQGAKTAYMAGPTDIGDTTAVKLSPAYKFTQTDNYAVIEMSGSKGSLSATSPQNWNFVNDSINSTAQHIIIVTDKKPSSYSNAKEYELFREALGKIKDTGKNVFVISGTGYDTDERIMDGISYINLGSLFGSENKISEDFRVLRIRIIGNSIYYDLQEIS
ncbi:MAG: phosphodiester glycosidase family protein [Clostridiales bacterium]|jgi:exopolysaccharide biosynthesis protein|nr:phosphodiester glycosidase family protein [Clostridiales bacterium]